jgi:solute:Na+ symporter, SSS family
MGIRTADLIVVILYMLGTAAIGVYFSKRNKTTEEYFLGGRSFPGWAIGLSMIGTSISSITFLALPAAAFALDWRQSSTYLTLPIICTLAIIFFIPIFRKKKITSAYEYLEERFGPGARIYGAICFLLGESLRLGTVLFLLSIPISLMTGYNMNMVIVVTGIFIAFYTIAGGIDAVIWTDVIQSFVLWLGGAFVVFFMLYKIPGGFDGIVDVGMQFNKFSLGPLDFDLKQRTFYVLIIMGVFSWMYMYTANQNVVQRYLAAKSTREARKATIICVCGSLPTWFIFYFIGTSLFVYFRLFPDPKVVKMASDEVFPYFILNMLPQGVAGLIIAGVLAAAMSSLDSSLNSFSAICTTDFLRRFIAPDRSERYYIISAKLFSVLAMVLMIIGALVFANIPKESMFDLGFIIGGLLCMLVLGFFILGIFCPFVKNRSLWIGFYTALVINIYLVLCYFDSLPKALDLNIHVYWNSVICKSTMIIVAIATALLWPEKQRKKAEVQG